MTEYQENREKSSLSKNLENKFTAIKGVKYNFNKRDGTKYQLRTTKSKNLNDNNNNLVVVGLSDQQKDQQEVLISNTDRDFKNMPNNKLHERILKQKIEDPRYSLNDIKVRSSLVMGPSDPKKKPYPEQIKKDDEPTEIPYFNQCFDKSRVKSLVTWYVKVFGENTAVELVEKLKELGFYYATHAGISIGIDDLKIPANKFSLVAQAETSLYSLKVEFSKGNLTSIERFQKLIETWHRTSESIKQDVINYFRSTNVLNPIYMMAFSGARGNISQVRQLVGMRGLMADPQGRILDFPIQSNFREGLTLTEYIISCYGARKGVVDTALRTAKSGYLTRRLVDVAQHIVVSKLDCGTKLGLLVKDLKSRNKVLLNLERRLVGRVLAETIYLPPDNKKKDFINIQNENDLLSPNIKGMAVDPKNPKQWPMKIHKLVPRTNQPTGVNPYAEPGESTNKISKTGNKQIINAIGPNPLWSSGPFDFLKLKNSIIKGKGSGGPRIPIKDLILASRNQEISPQLAHEIIKHKKEVLIRSPLSCQAKQAVCQLCYGWSLSQKNLVALGEAVGVIAAQSIGEPGTQLTMRTFHTGGVFSADVLDQIYSPSTGKIRFPSSIEGTLIRTPDGKIAFFTQHQGYLEVVSGIQYEVMDSELVRSTIPLAQNGPVPVDSNRSSLNHIQGSLATMFSTKPQPQIEDPQSTVGPLDQPKHDLQSESDYAESTQELKPNIETKKDWKHLKRNNFKNIKIFNINIPPYTALFVRQGEMVYKNQLIGETSFKNENETEADQSIETHRVVYSEIDGEIYFENVPVNKKIITKISLTKPTRQFSLQTISGLGSLWILSGKQLFFKKAGIQTKVLPRANFVGPSLDSSIWPFFGRRSCIARVNLNNIKNSLATMWPHPQIEDPQTKYSEVISGSFSYSGDLVYSKSLIYQSFLFNINSVNGLFLESNDQISELSEQEEFFQMKHMDYGPRDQVNSLFETKVVSNPRIFSGSKNRDVNLKSFDKHQKIFLSLKISKLQYKKTNYFISPGFYGSSPTTCLVSSLGPSDLLPYRRSSLVIRTKGSKISKPDPFSNLDFIFTTINPFWTKRLTPFNFAVFDSYGPSFYSEKKDSSIYTKPDAGRPKPFIYSKGSNIPYTKNLKFIEYKQYFRQDKEFFYKKLKKKLYSQIKYETLNLHDNNIKNDLFAIDSYEGYSDSSTYILNEVRANSGPKDRTGQISKNLNVNERVWSLRDQRRSKGSSDLRSVIKNKILNWFPKISKTDGGMYFFKKVSYSIIRTNTKYTSLMWNFLLFNNQILLNNNESFLELKSCLANRRCSASKKETTPVISNQRLNIFDFIWKDQYGSKTNQKTYTKKLTIREISFQLKSLLSEQELRHEPGGTLEKVVAPNEPHSKRGWRIDNKLIDFIYRSFYKPSASHDHVVVKESNLDTKGHRSMDSENSKTKISDDQHIKSQKSNFILDQKEITQIFGIKQRFYKISILRNRFNPVNKTNQQLTPAKIKIKNFKLPGYTSIRKGSEIHNPEIDLGQTKNIVVGNGRYAFSEAKEGFGNGSEGPKEGIEDPLIKGMVWKTNKGKGPQDRTLIPFRRTLLTSKDWRQSFLDRRSITSIFTNQLLKKWDLNKNKIFKNNLFMISRAYPSHLSPVQVTIISSQQFSKAKTKSDRLYCGSKQKLKNSFVYNRQGSSKPLYSSLEGIIKKISILKQRGRRSIKKMSSLVWPRRDSTDSKNPKGQRLIKRISINKSESINQYMADYGQKNKAFSIMASFSSKKEEKPKGWSGRPTKDHKQNRRYSNRVSRGSSNLQPPIKDSSKQFNKILSFRRKKRTVHKISGVQSKIGLIGKNIRVLIKNKTTSKKSNINSIAPIKPLRNPRTRVKTSSIQQIITVTPAWIYFSNLTPGQSPFLKMDLVNGSFIPFIGPSVWPLRGQTNQKINIKKFTGDKGTSTFTEPNYLDQNKGLAKARIQSFKPAKWATDIKNTGVLNSSLPNKHMDFHEKIDQKLQKGLIFSSFFISELGSNTFFGPKGHYVDSLVENSNSPNNAFCSLTDQYKTTFDVLPLFVYSKRHKKFLLNIFTVSLVKNSFKKLCFLSEKNEICGPLDPLPSEKGGLFNKNKRPGPHYQIEDLKEVFGSDIHKQEFMDSENQKEWSEEPTKDQQEQEISQEKIINKKNPFVWYGYGSEGPKEETKEDPFPKRNQSSKNTLNFGLTQKTTLIGYKHQQARLLAQRTLGLLYKRFLKYFVRENNFLLQTTTNLLKTKDFSAVKNLFLGRFVDKERRKTQTFDWLGNSCSQTIFTLNSRYRPSLCQTRFMFLSKKLEEQPRWFNKKIKNYLLSSSIISNQLIFGQQNFVQFNNWENKIQTDFISKVIKNRFLDYSFLLSQGRPTNDPPMSYTQEKSWKSMYTEQMIRTHPEQSSGSLAPNKNNEIKNGIYDLNSQHIFIKKAPDSFAQQKDYGHKVSNNGKNSKMDYNENKSRVMVRSRVLTSNVKLLDYDKLNKNNFAVSQKMKWLKTWFCKQIPCSFFNKQQPLNLPNISQNKNYKLFSSTDIGIRQPEYFGPTKGSISKNQGGPLINKEKLKNYTNLLPFIDYSMWSFGPKDSLLFMDSTKVSLNDIRVRSSLNNNFFGNQYSSSGSKGCKGLIFDFLIKPYRVEEKILQKYQSKFFSRSQNLRSCSTSDFIKGQIYPKRGYGKGRSSLITFTPNLQGVDSQNPKKQNGVMATRKSQNIVRDSKNPMKSQKNKLFQSLVVNCNSNMINLMELKGWTGLAEPVFCLKHLIRKKITTPKSSIWGFKGYGFFFGSEGPITKEDRTLISFGRTLFNSLLLYQTSSLAQRAISKNAITKSKNSKRAPKNKIVFNIGKGKVMGPKDPKKKPKKIHKKSSSKNLHVALGNVPEQISYVFKNKKRFFIFYPNNHMVNYTNPRSPSISLNLLPEFSSGPIQLFSRSNPSSSTKQTQKTQMVMSNLKSGTFSPEPRSGYPVVYKNNDYSSLKNVGLQIKGFEKTNKKLILSLGFDSTNLYAVGLKYQPICSIKQYSVIITNPIHLRPIFVYTLASSNMTDLRTHFVEQNSMLLFHPLASSLVSSKPYECDNVESFEDPFISHNGDGSFRRTLISDIYNKKKNENGFFGFDKSKDQRSIKNHKVSKKGESLVLFSHNLNKKGLEKDRRSINVFIEDMAPGVQGEILKFYNHPQPKLGSGKLEEFTSISNPTSLLLLTPFDQIIFSTNNTKPIVKIGQFVRYGDLLTHNIGIDKSGQVLNIEKTNVTLRLAKPLLVSSGGTVHRIDGDFITKNLPLLTLSYKSLKTGDIVQGIPKIEELLEARQTKDGKPVSGHMQEQLYSLFVKLSQSANFSPQKAARQSLEQIQQRMVDRIQLVYQSQGISIADKHLEIIVRQMTAKVRILLGGKTKLLTGELVHLYWIESVNKFIKGLSKATYEPVLLPITRAALQSSSFISSASFQETTRVLTRAAIQRKTDFLRGLKESVILGHLIPAGTGYFVYQEAIAKEKGFGPKPDAGQPNEMYEPFKPSDPSGSSAQSSSKEKQEIWPHSGQRNLVVYKTFSPSEY